MTEENKTNPTATNPTSTEAILDAVAVTNAPAAAKSGETETKEKDAKKKVSAKKTAKVFKNVPTGKAFIQATYNNTMVTITDLNGNTLAWSSAGHLGFKGPKKATPFAATMIVREAVEKTRNYNLREVYVYVKGVGSGRESAIRALNANGLEILGIKDITPLPHNGPRPPKVRRV